MSHVVRPSGRRSTLPRIATEVLLAGVVTVAGAAFVPVPAAAALPDVTAAVSASPTEAPDEATAMHLAWKTRKPVEIAGERTESSETFAQPDGTLRTREYATPFRVRRGSGWVPVNTDLKVADGVVVPEAATLDVRFSAGGAGPMLTVVKDGRSLSMSWTGTLPAPRLSGATATYAEVLPGVDLELTAKVDSFTQVLVVKTPAAAENSQVRYLQFGLATQGVTVRQDAAGFITAVDPAGTAVFASDGARMWDRPVKVKGPDITPPKALAARASEVPPTPLPADPEPALSANLPVRVDADSIDVVPSQEMLTNPATKWPVYIDPGFNGGSEIWTHVNRKNPGKSYWSDSNRDTMRVGQVWGGSADDDWRTLVQFDVTKLKKATIKRAGVLVNVKHSANCAPSPLQLWQTNAISKSSAVTWNSTKGKWWKVLGEVNATANKSSCPKGNDEVKFAQNAVRTAFQDAATKGNATITFAFRAKSESDQYQWKKLVAGSTYLDVEYNHTPGKPSNLTFSPCYVSCANNTAVTSSKRPTLGMKAADPNGGTLRYEYEVYATDKKTQKAKSGTTVTGVASGAQRTWSLKADLADGQYYWRGRACDTYICGTYSDWFGFKIDSTNPNNPKVSSTAYPATGWNGGPGLPGLFTFSPGGTADAIRTYAYALNGGTETKITPPANGIVDVSLTPAKDMVNTLRLKAIDTAGNLSGAVDYVFKVRPVGDAWYWSLDEGAGTTAASEPTNNRPLTMAGTGVTWSESGKDGDSAATFAGTGEMSTASPVFNTLSPAGFTVAAWVRLPAPEPADGGEEPGEQPGEGTEPGAGEGDDPEGGGTPSDEEQGEETSSLPTSNQVAVSQDGRNASMFRLGYRADLDLDGDAVKDPAWCFTVKAQDLSTAGSIDACTTSYVEAGAWVHLVGIVNPVTNRIQLYVNGIPARDGVFAEQSGTATWEATGRLAVGRGWVDGNAVHRWVGEIDEVHVTPRVWSEQEIYEKSRVVELEVL
jgi:hypothetical protein